MTVPKPDSSERARLLAKAVSRWDNEGGAGESGPVLAESYALQADALPLTNAELAHLQVRVIALENLLKVLLVDASDEQVALMREVATLILPRHGSTQHPLTIQAAACMINLIESAGHLREIHSDPSKIEVSTP